MTIRRIITSFKVMASPYQRSQQPARQTLQARSQIHDFLLDEIQHAGRIINIPEFDYDFEPDAS